MPLQENENVANIVKEPPLNLLPQVETSDKENDKLINVMKSSGRTQVGTSKEVLHIKAWKVDSPHDAPQLTLEHVQSSIDMAQINGMFKEQDSSSRTRNVSGRLTNGSGTRASPLNPSETSPSPEQVPWSSAIGHASTGKSGRVIERLQGDIDRLHREKQLLKVRFEEAEKASEALQMRNQYLQDRNSNYEQSHEASLRQLERKERQVEELREELKREKAKTARAEEVAHAAAEREENSKIEASQAKTLATQREIEYETMVACRNRDNDGHQSSLDKMKEQFEALLRQREEDLEKQKKLEIIAEQQIETIGQLEELTKRLNSNFRSYRTEIDTAIAGMRKHVNSNEDALLSRLIEMKEVTDKMRWVMNIEKEINHKGRSPQKGKA